MDDAFDDLLAANREYAETFDMQGFDGIAQKGVAVVTCMDSRLDPIGMIGLKPGEAKILRNPGGRVTGRVLVALVLGVNLLKVDRVLVVQHTRCAMASSSEQELKDSITDVSGQDITWMDLGAISDPEATLAEDVHRVETHPVIGGRIKVAGFVYDVDTGLLERKA
ncbi:MAG: beta-class carbonic anhydrase [Agrococcus casei]|uniref:beta-class carbonic anhydrase n=1 Tax=Agrococcus casei TaxID=343512 RepID=UPI003F90F4B5